MVRPEIGTEFGVMTAAVGAIDQHLVDAHLAQLAEGDLLGTGGQGADRSREVIAPAAASTPDLGLGGWETESS